MDWSANRHKYMYIEFYIMLIRTVRGETERHRQRNKERVTNRHRQRHRDRGRIKVSTSSL